MKRTTSALSSSPRKYSRVVSRLATQLVNPPPFDVSTQYISQQKLKIMWFESITKFYMRPNIRWAAPGKKDCITVRSGGEKERRQPADDNHQRSFHIVQKRVFSQCSQPNKVPVPATKVSALQSCMPHNVCVSALIINM